MNEMKLMDYIKKEFGNPTRRYIKKPFKFIDYEVPIMGDDEVPRGYMDLLVKQGPHVYGVEIKYKKEGGCGMFWDGFKIVGYVKLYNDTMASNIKPALLIPREHVNEAIISLSQEFSIQLYSWEEDDFHMWIREGIDDYYRHNRPKV